MAELVDIAVIGGGASGLAAAIFASEADASRRIVVLDTARTLGAKILVSGGGRCNVTHSRVVAADFNAKTPIVRNILAAFDEAATVRWFQSMGVDLKTEETGKLFPVSDSARTVVEALLRRCQTLGIQIHAASRVTSVERMIDADPAFVVRGTGFSIRARRVVLAAGGKSLPRSGSDGSGWELARSLGHTVTPTCAALAPMVLDPAFFHSSLSGIAIEVELSTFVSGKLADRRTGSLLFTHFGISGPVVMDASRHWIMPTEAKLETRLVCKFLPAESFETLERRLIEAATSRPRAMCLKVIAERLPERVAAALLRLAGVDVSLPIGQLGREPRRGLVHALTALPLPVLHHRGWNYAEVTAGGVPLGEIDYRTMESRRVPNLYIVGEMLDCDGRIGGFNFQWAWATGYIAGNAAAQTRDPSETK